MSNVLHCSKHPKPGIPGCEVCLLPNTVFYSPTSWGHGGEEGVLRGRETGEGKSRETNQETAHYCKRININKHYKWEMTRLLGDSNIIISGFYILNKIK